MTTIIGIQQKNGCVLVADSLVTDESGRKFWHPEMKKIAERGSFLVAGSGEVLPCDIIQHNWEPPIPTSKDKQDLYHFMVSKVVPTLRHCLTDNGYNFDEAHDKKDGERFHLLIAINGVIFDVDQELSITMNADGVYAIGSGGEIALGAIHAGADAYEAMEIVSRLSAYTAGPFISKEQFKHI
jgi:ATP-dependent protease HslVU (ClpYQ) peptidase subunit